MLILKATHILEIPSNTVKFNSYIFPILSFKNHNTAASISNGEVITTLLESHR